MIQDHKNPPEDAVKLAQCAHLVDKHVGARLLSLRQMRQVSQDQLGKALGLTFQQIQKYERGLNRISAGRLLIAAKFLGVPVSYFYEGLPVGEEFSAWTREDPKNRVPIDPNIIPGDDKQLQELMSAYTRIADPRRREALATAVQEIANALDGVVPRVEPVRRRRGRPPKKRD